MISPRTSQYLRGPKQKIQYLRGLHNFSEDFTNRILYHNNKMVIVSKQQKDVCIKTTKTNCIKTTKLHFTKTTNPCIKTTKSHCIKTTNASLSSCVVLVQGFCCFDTIFCCFRTEIVPQQQNSWKSNKHRPRKSKWPLRYG